MLLGLIFRGVAFEFRWRTQHGRDSGTTPSLRARHWRPSCKEWCWAPFCRAFVLRVDLTRAAGGIGCRLFRILTGLSLMAGYATLGAGWIILKTEGELQQRAGRTRCGAALIVHYRRHGADACAAPAVVDRWFQWPNMLLWPVPALIALSAYWAGMRCGAAATRTFPRDAGLVPALLHRARHQRLSDDRADSVTVAAASPAASIPARRHGDAASDHPRLHRLAYWVFRGKVRTDVGYGHH